MTNKDTMEMGDLDRPTSGPQRPGSLATRDDLYSEKDINDHVRSSRGFAGPVAAESHDIDFPPLPRAPTPYLTNTHSQHAIPGSAVSPPVYHMPLQAPGDMLLSAAHMSLGERSGSGQTLDEDLDEAARMYSTRVANSHVSAPYPGYRLFAIKGKGGSVTRAHGAYHTGFPLGEYVRAPRPRGSSVSDRLLDIPLSQREAKAEILSTANKITKPITRG